MTQGREYLVLRYDPGMAELAPLNRLWATLDEIARKVTRAVAAPAAADGTDQAAGPGQARSGRSRS